MEWLDFLGYLPGRMSDWDQLRALAGILGPIIIAGGLYALGAVNPALGFIAGAVVSLAQADYKGAARDSVVQAYTEHPGKLVSAFGNAVSNALTAVNIGEAYAESAKRLGELLAERAGEMEMAKPSVSGPDIPLEAPIQTPTRSGSSASHILVARKFVDLETLSKQTGISVKNLAKNFIEK